MELIKQFGELWARNPENISDVPESSQGGQGVYILYDGSTPVYVGIVENIKNKEKGSQSARDAASCKAGDRL